LLVSRKLSSIKPKSSRNVPKPLAAPEFIKCTKVKISVNRRNKNYEPL